MGQKEILGPNLHVCGKDGAQRGVYKLKEEHERKEIGTEKERRRTDLNKKEESKRREKELR